MDKKELINKKEAASGQDKPGSGKKQSGFSDKLSAIVKFIFGILLLPFVYTATKTFLIEFSQIDAMLQNYFWSGVIGFLLVNFFLWEPQVIYDKGHSLLEESFSFFQPLVKVAPYLLPIYAIILTLAYAGLSLTIKSEWLIKYFLILFGFTISLHLVFAAKTLRGKKGDLLKGNYIFGFSFIYLINLLLIALIFNFIFEKFSLVNFCNNSFLQAKCIFEAVFKQLFVP
ncbi:MAG: hypothetical protein HY761_09400 [Candidatus Omnitrophica bacterium]|nr:hypothetical protein [Candidatus Omnitrophota bacterium]